MEEDFQGVEVEMVVMVAVVVAVKRKKGTEIRKRQCWFWQRPESCWRVFRRIWLLLLRRDGFQFDSEEVF
jgi:hypothetical protein